MNIENKFYKRNMQEISRQLVKIKLLGGDSSPNVIMYNNSENEIKLMILSEYENTDSGHSELKVIMDNILENYVDFINNKKLLWKGQNIYEEEKLSLFHWTDWKQRNSIDNLSRRFYTSMNKEGVIITEIDSIKNLSKINYSFRYDQIINCEGYRSPKSLKKITKYIQIKIFKIII